MARHTLVKSRLGPHERDGAAVSDTRHMSVILTFVKRLPPGVGDREPRHPDKPLPRTRSSTNASVRGVFSSMKHEASRPEPPVIAAKSAKSAQLETNQSVRRSYLAV
jgi:hypothetical protein